MNYTKRYWEVCGDHETPPDLRPLDWNTDTPDGGELRAAVDTLVAIVAESGGVHAAPVTGAGLVWDIGPLNLAGLRAVDSRVIPGP